MKADAELQTTSIEPAKTESPARDELATLLSRRKRLLTELYLLSKYSEVPQEYLESHGAADLLVEAEDVAGFLAATDLERGYSFDESKLPKVFVAAVPPSELPQAVQLVVSESDQRSDRTVVVETTGIAGSGIIVEEQTPSSQNTASEAATSRVKATKRADRSQHEPRHAQVVSSELNHNSTFDSASWLAEASQVSLKELMESANKCVTTAAWNAALQEQKWVSSLDRIHKLKAAHKWSLRQPVRQQPRVRNKCTWDFLLEEMKWLQTDFRQERKWKVAIAHTISQAVLAWHEAEPEQRNQLVIRCRPVQHIKEDHAIADVEYEPLTPPGGADPQKILPNSVQAVTSEQTPRLVDTSMHSPPLSAIDDNTNLFDFPIHEVIAHIPMLDTGTLLPDLPLYATPCPDNAAYIEPFETTPICNTSRYTTAQVSVQAGRKRPIQELEDAVVTYIPQDHFNNSGRRRSSQQSLTLRPPPLPAHIDRREADKKEHKQVWTSETDEMLLGLLYEYQFNWEFVANCLTPASSIVAVADRKSPWDCFERWIQIDPKASETIFTGPQARIIHNRLDDIIRVPKADRPSMVRRPSVVAHLYQSDLKKQRQFSLFDAMRKVQRKRENSTKPTTIPKKIVTDASKTPPVVPTPLHLSQMKFERDQQIARAFVESKNQQALAAQQRLIQQKQGTPATPAQIAQLQAARQTQQRAQLAQQATPNGTANTPTAVNGRPLSGTPIPRPSLVGQMPPRPTSASLLNGLNNGANPNSAAALRIPPGQRLNQEQMSMLIQQARLQKGMSASPQPLKKTPTPTTPKPIIQKEPASEKAR